jgi:hypothetical protein
MKMAREKFEPFPEGDDFNELSDRLRRDVSGLVLLLQSSRVYESLSPTEQIECVMAGLTTALVGTTFAMVERKSQKEVLKAIKSYLPQAAAQVNAIMDRPSPTGQP